MPPSPPEVIKLENVWKIFGDRSGEAMQAVQSQNLSKSEVLERFDCVVGVADATFSVAEGEIFCVMGLSGSGKSTLIRHINRLIDPTAGRILVHDEDISSKSEEELRRLRSERMGMVFQHFGLMPHRTVRDNVAQPLEVRGVGKRKRWQEAERVLSMVQLDGWEDRFAHELSGGMQQRVGLGRALAANPGILLMDEPFSALDPLIRRKLQDEFMELAAMMKKTTVFITHDLDEAIRIGHRIAIMKDGRIVQIGTAEEIVTDPADEYVRDFVAGISRLKLVYAHTIMKPVVQHTAEHGSLPAAAPRVSEDCDLDGLIDLAVTTPHPMVITGPEGREVGVVSHNDLLLGIQGSKEAKSMATTVAEPAETRDTAEDEVDALVQHFAGHNDAYYVRQFRRIGEAANFAPTFNPMAALLGPMWFGSRNLWGWVLPFMILEIIALIPLGRGLWSDLGYEYLERADKIAVTLEQRREQHREALAEGADNAPALQGIIESLEGAVQDTREAATAATERAPWLIATGVVLLLLFKAIQGGVANWALEQRFTRWRSDRSLRTGLDPPAALAAAVFAGVCYGATVTQFTVTQPIEILAEFPTDRSYQYNLAKGIKAGFGELAIRGEHLFDGVTFGLRSVLNALEIFFIGTPWIVIMGIVILLAWRTAGARMAIFAIGALAYLGVLGFWEKAMSTVALLGTAACISITVGIPVGIICARSRRAFMVVRPMLDLMQTMPAFVYLIPVIAFFGSGKPAGIIATMVFGSPPVVRLTVLGLRGVPESVREAAMAFGASARYLLFKVDIPLAAPTIMAGVNQTIMLSLSMVVISSLIGAKGLGEMVLEALQFAAEGKGILSGIAILFCAIILDRIVQGKRR